MTGLRPFVAENKSEHERNTDSNLTPSGNFHRRLHWVVRGFCPALVFCEAGEGPLCRAVLVVSVLHLWKRGCRNSDLSSHPYDLDQTLYAGIVYNSMINGAS